MIILKKLEWWVKRKGRKDLGPLTHRAARDAALVMARGGGKPPALEHRPSAGPTRSFVPRFPELRR